MSFDLRAITQDEDSLRADIQQAPEWALTGRASETLARMLVAIPRTSWEGPIDEAGPVLRLTAQRIIGFRIFRTVRAAMAVVSIGYEPEARALDRVLVELTTHRDVIEGDPSGDEAQRWLQGKAGKGITAKVKASSPGDLYANLSQDAHGDPRPTFRLYDHESESYILGPSRKPFAARLSLLLYASAACDQTVILSRLGGTGLPGLRELHAEVTAAWRQAHEDADAAEDDATSVA